MNMLKQRFPCVVPWLWRVLVIMAFTYSWHYWRADSFGPLVDAFTVFFMVGLAGAVGIMVNADVERDQKQRDEIKLLKAAVKSLRAAQSRVPRVPPNGETARIDRQMTREAVAALPRYRGTGEPFNARRSGSRPQSWPPSDAPPSKMAFSAPHAVVPYDFLPTLDLSTVRRFSVPPANTMRLA